MIAVFLTKSLGLTQFYGGQGSVLHSHIHFCSAQPPKIRLFFHSLDQLVLILKYFCKELERRISTRRTSSTWPRSYTPSSTPAPPTPTRSTPCRSYPIIHHSFVSRVRHSTVTTIRNKLYRDLQLNQTFSVGYNAKDSWRYILEKVVATVHNNNYFSIYFSEKYGLPVLVTKEVQVVHYKP